MFVTDSGTAIPIANTLDILTSISAAGSIPIQTTGATNVVTIHAQKTQAIASTDATKIGLAAFDSSEFSVDANGFVTLAGGSVTETLTGNSGGAVAPNGSNNIFTVGDSTGITVVGSPGTNTLTWSLVGGGIAIQSVDVDAHTAPGTDPVVPNASGQIAITGAQVAAGTTTNVIRTDSLAANAFTIEVQRSQAVASTTIGDNGVSHFNSAMFSVDANGFVSLAGGGQAIDSIAVQTGTSPIVPTGAGLVTINGAVVAAGTNPIRTDGTGANTMAVEVQISQAIAATDATKIGLCNFDSARFSVDANGFVTINGAGIGETITGQSGGALSPTAGNWNIFGASTAAGTSPVVTSGSVSTLTVNVQKSQAIAATDATKIGLASFDSASFAVDANGFVTTSGTGLLKTLTGNSGGAISPTAGNINTLGTGSITIAGSGSTLTTQLTGLTNHNVLIGAGTATITNVAPSATSGVPLISQGAAADPTFGTAVVAGGGTGATSFTAYAPVCGGTTTTNPLQSASTGLSTSGFVLTSNGAAALPSFQDVSASGAIKTITGNTGGAESPSSGNFNILGTGSITVAGSANTETVQLTGLTNHSLLVGAGTATITNLGVATNGQLPIGSTGADPVLATLSAGTGISITNGVGSITIASTGSPMSWTDQTGAFAAASGHGYFITGTSTATLPASPSQGDTIAFIVDTTNVLTITGNTGQVIRIGSAVSAAAGTAASNARGDAVTLVYRSTGTAWIAQHVQGTFTVT